MKKHKLNSLLKLALISSIIFGVVNSVSAKEEKTQKIDIEQINLDIPIFITSLSFFIFWCFNKKQQQKKFSEIEKHQKNVISQFNQLNELNNKFNNLERSNRQIIEKIQENNQKIIDSATRLHESINKQQVNHFISDRNNSDFNSNTNFYSLNSDTSNLNSIAIVDKILQFVETYNRDRNSISDQVKAMVAETQASINQRRLGNRDTVTLENTSKKKYWIIEEDNEHYLIPHAKIKIDEHNRTTLESLFDCTNFTSEYSDFQLVKPARVSQTNLETWQLETKGELEFS